MKHKNKFNIERRYMSKERMLPEKLRSKSCNRRTGFSFLFKNYNM